MPDPLVFRAASIDWEAGAPERVRPLFEAVAELEPDGWGSRFPHFMTELYRGEIPAAAVPAAREELRLIRDELSGSFPATGGKEMLHLLDRALTLAESIERPVKLAHEFTFRPPSFESVT